MSARRAFVWLALLTVALVGLTLLVHVIPLRAVLPKPTRMHIVLPASDTPTLTAGAVNVVVQLQPA
jgi:hypothetical protein